MLVNTKGNETNKKGTRRRFIRSFNAHASIRPMTAIAKMTPAPRETATVAAELAVWEGEGAPLELAEDGLASDFAFAWKASKLFAEDSTALAANTMPCWQWLTGLAWRQNAQMGAVYGL